MLAIDLSLESITLLLRNRSKRRSHKILLHSVQDQTDDCHKPQRPIGRGTGIQIIHKISTRVWPQPCDETASSGVGHGKPLVPNSGGFMHMFWRFSQTSESDPTQSLM